MILDKITSIAENIADDYGLDGVDSVEKINDQHAEITFIANDTTELTINVYFASKSIRKAILKALVEAYSEYDLQDEVEQLGISADTIDYLDRANDNKEANEQTQSLMISELNGEKPLNSFQDSMMAKIDGEAQMMHQDAYIHQSLPVMKTYVQDMYYFSRSEGLYNELKNVLDTNESSVHTFLYEPNFFSFIATEPGRKSVDLFEAGHHAEAIDQVLEYNYQLTRKSSKN